MMKNVPTEQLLTQFYALWAELNVRINTEIPNLKARPEIPYSFYSFIAQTIERAAPVSVLDLGAHNCSLSAGLAEIAHPESRFICVDAIDVQPRALHPNVCFRREDIFQFIASDGDRRYDYAILGAVLGLFDTAGRRDLLEFVRRSCRRVYVREVPKLTNLVDLYCERDLVRLRGWDNFTERGLVRLLDEHGFEIERLEHEYDVYVLAGFPSRAQAS
jgi:hypothetical protein